MKKILITFIGLFILTLASCEKEEITPTSQQEEWDRSMNDNSDNNQKSATNSNGFVDTRNDLDTTFTITDPNRDEDEDRKGKKE